jgi:adenylate kinase family enzyme
LKVDGGTGKSTLAIKIAKRTHGLFRKMRKQLKAEVGHGGELQIKANDYYFNPKLQLEFPRTRRYLLYTKEDVTNFFNKWKRIGIADEMINVAFNREFWNEDQKNLIKIMNMNRDHCNMLLMCIPQFQVLDNQIKNLCKIRITVVRRGIAVIQTPNKTIYNKDIWDSAVNEKIEREWIKKGGVKPAYNKLTTYKGLLLFRKLTEKDQDIYDKIKNQERNIIAGDLGVTDIDKKEPLDLVVERLLSGGVKNSAMLDGMAFALGENTQTFRRKLRSKLEKMGKPSSLAYFFWDKKEKEEDETETMND